MQDRKRSLDDMLTSRPSIGIATNNNITTVTPQPNAKRQKTTVITEDLLCPITLELPYDAVTALDGRLYERRAIEKHFDHCHEQGHGIKSPITNEFMGDKLLPSPQTRNHIQVLIDNGLVTDELKDAWNKRIQQQKDMEELVKMAETGDSESMFRVGRNYLEGEKGFRKDLALGHRWTERAHQAGCIRATAKIGINILKGVGTEANEHVGVMYTSMAAGMGSSMAAYRMGIWFSEGKYGIAQNKTEALYWLRSCLTHKIRDLNKLGRQAASDKIAELTGQNNGASDDSDA